MLKVIQQNLITGLAPRKRGGGQQVTAARAPHISSRGSGTLEQPDFQPDPEGKAAQVYKSLPYIGRRTDPYFRNLIKNG